VGEGEEVQLPEGISMGDMMKVLVILDDLLEHLPEEVINEFVDSEHFELYKKVMTACKSGSE
jgi:hypothetical protein